MKTLNFICASTLSSKHERGSLLVFSSFLILTISIILISYWKLYEYRLKMLTLKKHETRALYAAKAGVEDAIEELKQNNEWDQTDINLSEQWVFSDEDTFYKSTSAPYPLTHFSYPVTFSVTVSGNPDEDMFTIESISTIYDETTQQVFSKTIFAYVIKTFNDNFELISVHEERQ